MVNVPNNEKIYIPSFASLKKKAIFLYIFFIKNSNKKTLLFNQKYIAKITNPQFLTIKKMPYTGIQ